MPGVKAVVRSPSLATPASPIAALTEVAISPVVVPEALTGSTRLKSGTAQKLVLNMLSMKVMIKLEKVYQNLMVDVKVTNKKLIDRVCRIVMEAIGAARDEAQRALQEIGYAAKPAILMILSGISAVEIEQRLERHHGYLRDSLLP